MNIITNTSKQQTAAAVTSAWLAPQSTRKSKPTITIKVRKNKRR